MKTKELIKQLQEEDPSGELEVSVGNCDIFFVEALPGYYDGCQQVLIRDHTSQYYNVIGGKYNASGTKVSIHTHAFSDAIWDNPDLPIDYSDLNKDRAERYREANDKQRVASRDCSYKIELEEFTKHIRERAGQMESELDGIEEAAKKFFDANLSADDLFPPDIPWQNESYITRRNKQWAREVSLDTDWNMTLTRSNV